MSSATHYASRSSVSSVIWVSGLVFASIVACAAVTSGQAGLRSDYVMLGEGVSSAASDTEIEFAGRMFTIYLLDEACRNSRAGDVVRLRAQPSRLTLNVGEPFSPGSLKVAALDASGALLPKVPIAVELKSPSGVFDKGRDAFASDVLVPVSPARVTLRARTMCRGPAAEVFVGADIRRR
jgi:hypothetical protein